MKIFHICTIANKIYLYNKMKQSFIQAGFNEDKCRYSLFDNSEKNIFDPYKTFNYIQSNTTEPYIIFCHQDVVMNQGDGFQDLVKVLENLDGIDSKWAIAGNAGINNQFEAVVKITDPNLTPNWKGSFPQKVHSLDENFLVIKSKANIQCSSELFGFHFYGTDLCLNAILKGYSCYVVDFHLTHLSAGKLDEYFYKTKENFQEYWMKKIFFCYLKTMTQQTIFFSKYKIIRNFFSKKNIQNWCLSRRKLKRFLTIYHF